MVEKLGKDGATRVRDRLQTAEASPGRRSAHDLQVGDTPSSLETSANPPLGEPQPEVNQTLLMYD
jgi:hypothetical protein